MWISKEDINNLFDRLRFLENKVNVKEEHNNNLEELFIKHDKEEMIKYNKIQERLDSMDKKQQKNENIKYSFVAVFLFFEFLQKMGFISF